MLHTSGTTSRPKMVPLTEANLCVSAINIAHWLKLDPKIAAGPVTLALADLIALVIYFTSGSLVLR